MQITEMLNEGLQRTVKVVVPVSHMEKQLGERLEEARRTAKINGFRPGKVPLSHIQKTYGKSMMVDLVNEIINEQTKAVPASRGERAAMRPEVLMTEDKTEAEAILDAKADFEFSLSYEILPKISVSDFSQIAISRPIVEIAETEIEEQIARLTDFAKEYKPSDKVCENGDRVTMGYVGKVDGIAFAGGTDENADLVLGSKSFIPGFEDQLLGLKAGDSKQINVTFPADYGAKDLAGKEATFDVTVSVVSTAQAVEINDELAKKVGLDSLDALRDAVRKQIEGQFGIHTRQKIKRQLLDALDAAHQFETPTKLVEAEFNNIWLQVTKELSDSGKSFADEDTTEEAARAEYLNLAKRRVRLGLLLAEIGQKANIEVSDQELQRAIYDQVRQHKGQEQQVYDYFTKTPDALAALRAPLFEEKVVDKILSEAKVTDIIVTKEELTADDEAEAKGTTKEVEAKPAKEKTKAAKKPKE
jgi:trigger factor